MSEAPDRGAGRVRPLDERIRFVRERTQPAPVPAVPELIVHQATEVTPLWHATAAELDGWDPAPFWAFPWAGGQALARYLLARPELVLGMRVFDFATGGGVVALAAARAGASRVVACDIDPMCEAAVRVNAELNGLSVEFRGGDALGEALPGFDVVLAGDVFYEERLARESLAWLSSLAARGLLAMAGDPGRIYSPAGGVVERGSYAIATSAEIERDALLVTRVLEILPESRPRGTSAAR